MYKHYYPEESLAYNVYTHQIEEFLSDLEKCLLELNDPELPSAINEQWKGMAHFYQFPDVDDPWINCYENPDHSRCTSSNFAEAFDEENRYAIFGPNTDREMFIMEPCNYVSNIAYYHGAIRLCDYFRAEEYDDEKIPRALKRSYATLSAGSSFMHASHTDLGGLFDNLLIAVIVFINYQDIIDALGWKNVDELACFFNHPSFNLDQNFTINTNEATMPNNTNGSITSCDNINAIDVAETTTFFSINFNVSEWMSVLEQVSESIPNKYEVTFTACVYIFIQLVFPAPIGDGLYQLLANALLPPKLKKFVDEEYIPIAKPLLQSVELPFLQRIRLIRMFFGSLLKILYAFVWQEQTLEVDVSSWLGFLLAPVVNLASTILNGFDHGRFDWNIAFGRNLYPGFDTCNHISKHAFWHQQSGVEGEFILETHLSY